MNVVANDPMHRRPFHGMGGGGQKVILPFMLCPIGVSSSNQFRAH